MRGEECKEANKGRGRQGNNLTLPSRKPNKGRRKRRGEIQKGVRARGMHHTHRVMSLTNAHTDRHTHTQLIPEDKRPPLCSTIPLSPPLSRSLPPRPLPRVTQGFQGHTRGTETQGKRRKQREITKRFCVSFSR